MEKLSGPESFAEKKFIENITGGKDPRSYFYLISSYWRAKAHERKNDDEKKIKDGKNKKEKKEKSRKNYETMIKYKNKDEKKKGGRRKEEK